jgi:hypothetical protein
MPQLYVELRELCPRFDVELGPMTSAVMTGKSRTREDADYRFRVPVPV